ncbi:MAG TPA: sugar transferase [Chitinophagaceae bacterium]|nr:sugar transferase [Chitinophagaceae bacterium]
MEAISLNIPLKKKFDYAKLVKLIDFQIHIRNKFYFFFFKRLIDICFSLCVIVFLLAWIVPLLSILIFLDSGGPVFFIQRRVGRFGKSFSCLKFRTMRVNDEANFKQATENDSRITKLGKFLRKTNLDELPQFFNVLIGDMSIVGPRPHMHHDCYNFSQIIKNYKLRSLIKPGITGLSQIKGYRGPTTTIKSITDRFYWDIFYIKTASANKDIYIILKTASQTIRHIGLLLFKNNKFFYHKYHDLEYENNKNIAA